MERGLVMVVHGVALALVAYVLMVYALKQSPAMAETDRFYLAPWR